MMYVSFTILHFTEFRTGCYSSINCTGEVVVGPHTARECCVGTDDGHSYAVDGVCTVVECRGIVITLLYYC